ncbi:MAG: response regulator [Deltaproteobacteria bacterium]|nr:response regulator [Deltaproteobacteria bacterium]
MPDPVAILIVEDDPAHATLMTRALELGGDRYRVQVAPSLAAGRRAIALARPALVVADLNLGDGRALDLLPGAPHEPPFPLLVLTSHGDEHAAVATMRSGALDYLTKSPETFAALPQLVEGALREWRLIEERRAAERALRASEARFRALFEAAPDAIVIHDAHGRVTDCNRATEELVGRPRAALLGATLLPHAALSPEDVERSGQHALDLQAGRATGPDVFTLRRDDGRQVDVEYRAVPLELEGETVALAIARDVTARRLAEETHRRLEEQLRQAAKMEAVGRLAGGVAHDFNNVLTVITSYSEVLLHEAPAGSSTEADLIEVQKAAKRAASLTAQLLAFSRKQVIEPLVIDLHELLGGAIRMLRRLIGEDIQLRFAPGVEVGSILVDPNQVEQVLINLAVNARDAMPVGGTLTIATANAIVDAEFATAHGGAAAGEYVQLSVSDTGSGMATDVLAHVFEPFFTTKPIGRGTGLGLSMVYGIVQQSGGFVRVRSEVGVGTSFDVYFPRHIEDAVAVPVGARSILPGGHEAVLIVEDELPIRELLARLLRAHGYMVATASGGAEAIALVAAGLRPQLLVADVVLAALNGREVFERLREQLPGLRVLYTSGYTADVVAQHGVIDQEAPFLQKPFSRERLLRLIRDQFDRVVLPR